MASNSRLIRTLKSLRQETQQCVENLSQALTAVLNALTILLNALSILSQRVDEGCQHVEEGSQCVEKDFKVLNAFRKVLRNLLTYAFLRALRRELLAIGLPIPLYTRDRRI